MRRHGYPVVSVANERIRKQNFVGEPLSLEVSILNRCTRDDRGITIHVCCHFRELELAQLQ